VFSEDLNTPKNENFNKYQGTGYQISFPEKWQVIRGYMGADLVGHEPYLTDFSKPKPSVTVYVERKPSGMGDLEFLEASKKALQDAFGASKKIAFTENNSLKEECYESSYDIVKGEYSAANRVLIFFKGNSAYTITVSMPHDASNKDIKLVDSVLKSFHFAE
jgi:hypothetical protein